MKTAAPGAVTRGSAAGEGASDAAARADHVHSTSGFTAPGACPAGQYETGDNANAGPTCATVTSATSATTAGSLASDPADCSSPQFARGINASGAAQCFTVDYSHITNTPTAFPPTSSSVRPSHLVNATAVTDGYYATKTSAADSFTWTALPARSGVGTCPANTWASTLNSGAAPTCTQPNFSNLSGSVALSQITDDASTGRYLASGGAGNPNWKQVAWSELTGVPSTFPATTPVSSASAFAADPMDCASPYYARGVTAFGTAVCAQPAYSELANTPASLAGEAIVTFGVSTPLTNERTLTAGTGTAIDTATAGQVRVNVTGRSGTGACSANTWASTLNDGGGPTCTQPSFLNLAGSASSAQLPDATASARGGLVLAGDLTGTASAPSVVDDSHAHTGATIAGLDAGTDISAGVLPQARGGTGNGSLVCPSGYFLTSDGTSHACSAPAGSPAFSIARLDGTSTAFSTTSTTPSTVLSWGIPAGGTYGSDSAFQCVLIVGGSATGGPRIRMTSPTLHFSPGVSGIGFRIEQYLTTSPTPVFEHLTGSYATPLSAGCTASCLSGVERTWTIAGRASVPAGGAGGTVALQLATSTTSQPVYVYRGSYCIYSSVAH